MLRSVVTLISTATLAATLACGGGRPQQTLGPNGSEAAVREFMKAVRDSNLSAMGRIWGSGRGLVADRLPADDVRRRLVVTQLYLQHERYEILPDSVTPTSDNERQFQVRLTRKGCTPTIPFTVARRGNAWLVSVDDLAAAGNPMMGCRPPGE